MARENNQRVVMSGLHSALGYTSAGEPLSYNRAPAEDLSPWVARIFATDVEADPDHVVSCGLVSDTPVLRILFRGDWRAENRDGVGRYRESALFFGPQTKRMKVSVKGSFATLGVALKPGAVTALHGPKVEETLDRILLYDHMYGDREWGSSVQLIEWFDPSGPPERWLKVAEKLLRQLIELSGGEKPDPIVEAFDKAAFANPNLNLGDFAQEHGFERRRLQRIIKKAYGQPAKQVLRRARALDIAAELRGVADNAEAEDMALRYYDQSHLNRDFTAFFGMTPKQFARTPQPLMTLTLEARQARRLEVLGRLLPGEDLPWRKRNSAAA